MAWIIELLAACDGDRPGPPPPACEFEAPSCTRPVVTDVVTLRSDQRGDFAGRYLDVVDLDADGCDEVLVTESHERRQDYYRQSTVPEPSAVHRLGPVSTSGLLRSEADTSWVAESPYANYWAHHPGVLGLPAVGQVLVAGKYVMDDGMFDAYAFGAASRGVVAPDRHATAVGTRRFDSLSHFTRCVADGVASLCASTRHDVADEQGEDYAGRLYVVTLPLPHDGVLDDAHPHWAGEPLERAEIVDGRTDVDGDCSPDLLVGAYAAGEDAPGKVALLADPGSTGGGSLWEAATATFVGETPGAEFGLFVGGGDLDGDGVGEVLVGAPLTANGALYVFRGPFEGERSAADAEWIVRGSEGSFDWLGYDAAVGDVDGDGRPDLAVGRPWSVYGGGEPGEVLIFLHPAPGRYDVADADLVLRGTSGRPDAFGISVEVGFLDGDERADLVIGAPIDPTGAREAGSVTVVHGAALGR